MYSERNRAFSYAVLASIVLHGMLLFAVSQPRQRIAFEEPEFPPIVARLAEPAAELPPPAPPAAEEPLVIPPEMKSPPVVQRPKPKPKPAPRAKPVPQREPVPEPPAVVEAPAPSAAQPAPPPLVARTEPAPAAPPVQAAPDPRTLLAEYRSELLAVARKYKRYPRAAMDNNWEGHVVVRLAVGANGALAGLSVQSSSGYALLDQQALDMFRKAATAVQVPPALRGREFTLEVRAIYNLTDQDSG